MERKGGQGARRDGGDDEARDGDVAARSAQRVASSSQIDI